jgi:hypothetical protein
VHVLSVTCNCVLGLLYRCRCGLAYRTDRALYILSHCLTHKRSSVSTMRVRSISLVCIAAAMVPARGHTRGAVAVPSWLKGVTLLYNNDGENLCDVTSPYVMPKPRFTLYSFVNFLAVAVRDKRDRRC